MIGIYKVTNIINGKVYIGRSVDIGTRWKRHIWDSNNPSSKEYNSLFHKDLREFGKDKFDFEILEECEEELLNEKEKYWINYFGSTDNNYGYNSMEGGSYISQKTVYQYDFNGNLLNTYKSTREAARINNCSSSHISKCCLGKIPSLKGYLWSYELRNDMKYTPKPGNRKTVYQYDLNNNLIGIYESTMEAERITGCNHRHISECCNGKLATHGGFIWSYSENKI